MNRPCPVPLFDARRRRIVLILQEVNGLDEGLHRSLIHQRGGQEPDVDWARVDRDRLSHPGEILIRVFGIEHGQHQMAPVRLLVDFDDGEIHLTRALQIVALDEIVVSTTRKVGKAVIDEPQQLAGSGRSRPDAGSFLSRESEA